MLFCNLKTSILLLLMPEAETTPLNSKFYKTEANCQGLLLTTIFYPIKP